MTRFDRDTCSQNPHVLVMIPSLCCHGGLYRKNVRILQNNTYMLMFVFSIFQSSEAAPAETQEFQLKAYWMELSSAWVRRFATGALLVMCWMDILSSPALLMQLAYQCGTFLYQSAEVRCYLIKENLFSTLNSYDWQLAGCVIGIWSALWAMFTSCQVCEMCSLMRLI